LKLEQIQQEIISDTPKPFIIETSETKGLEFEPLEPPLEVEDLMHVLEE
jgi:hypothetical protein